MQKIFKTLDEQIEILQKKGLVIDDILYAKEVLMRENYFFISGYRHLFLKSPRDREFIPGTNFNELYALFNFDRQIRNVVFKNILIIENNIKSIFSYQMSKKYGYRENHYLSPSSFDTRLEKQRQVGDLLKKMKRQIRVNGGQHSATTHYIQNYGYVPMWVAVKVLSFGIVSELYTVMKPVDQLEVAEVFEIDAGNLLTYLPILANFRNLCAHEDILYNHRTHRSIVDTSYHNKLGIPIMDGEYIYGKNDLFSLVIILKQMLTKDDFNLFLNEVSYEVDLLTGRLKSIEIGKILDALGFPENFREMAKVD